MGIVVPGLAREYEKGYPETLKNIWIPEFFAFRSKTWWRTLWVKTGLCEIIASYDIDDSKAIWQSWADWSVKNFATAFGADGEDDGTLDMRLLEADTNNDLALIAMAAKKI